MRTMQAFVVISFDPYLNMTIVLSSFSSLLAWATVGFTAPLGFSPPLFGLSLESWVSHHPCIDSSDPRFMSLPSMARISDAWRSFKG